MRQSVIQQNKLNKYAYSDGIPNEEKTKMCVQKGS